MSEYAGAILRGILDIVRRRTACGVQTRGRASPLGDFVIRAGSIAADSQTSDDLSVFIQRHAAAEEDHTSGNPVGAAALASRRRQEVGIKWIRLAQAPQRMSRLH